VLLAGTLLLLTVCAARAQTPAPSPQPSIRPDDPAKIHADEARLLAILTRNPDHPGALAGMGWVRSRQHNYPAAVSYLERALRQRPGDPQLNLALNQARFHVLLSEARHALVSGDPGSAHRFYSAALAIHPRDRDARDGLRTAARALRPPAQQ
jgi:tetratricopeptide (TPR) repeat protein